MVGLTWDAFELKIEIDVASPVAPTANVTGPAVEPQCSHRMNVRPSLDGKLRARRSIGQACVSKAITYEKAPMSRAAAMAVKPSKMLLNHFCDTRVTNQRPASIPSGIAGAKARSIASVDDVISPKS